MSFNNNNNNNLQFVAAVAGFRRVVPPVCDAAGRDPPALLTAVCLAYGITKIITTK